METALAEKAVEKFMRGPTSTTWAVAAVASWLVVVSFSGSNVSRSSLCTRAVISPQSGEQAHKHRIASGCEEAHHSKAFTPSGLKDSSRLTLKHCSVSMLSTIGSTRFTCKRARGH
jgi:hypothetical protein